VWPCRYLYLTDILPTAWHGTELSEVGKGDTVAVWGVGPGKHFICRVGRHSHGWLTTTAHLQRYTCQTAADSLALATAVA
jgi:hypothetical protein